VKERKAADKMTMVHIPSHENLVDVLSKRWSRKSVWHTLQPFLFWSGDMMECYVSEEDPVARKEKQHQQTKTVSFAKLSTQTM
jgi:hypothetical protein